MMLLDCKKQEHEKGAPMAEERVLKYDKKR